MPKEWLGVLMVNLLFVPFTNLHLLLTNSFHQIIFSVTQIVCLCEVELQSCTRNTFT